MTRSDRVESQAIGSYLRLQRELRAISVEELANLTRIPVRSIERLEAGYFDGQVDGFAKGFVRTVAESLGLDAEDTLARMLSEPEPEDRRLFHLKRRLSALFLGLSALALLGVLLFVVQHMSTRQARTAAQAREEIIYRRDPVRALAASRAGAQGAPAEESRASAGESGSSH